ncbi:type II toxin-antitoxin system VapC family toxin [Mesorhizobium sp. L-8-3]|uniref:type II toxin-antitoxin system VapC family toxin n=1 Tax=Mesorhizobium sp. L-8-3 TaxID=2744522 RepID=UPI0019267DA4|nr:type II toxin-antitoxin system VapC family toxin [Mesorhizobium sp. L-8-3]BCH26433.1 twitching motility protein PilT [Mesorhizobium sp. L-8-3]
MNDRRYLLDTHILLWILSGDDRLPARFRNILEQQPAQVVSAVSIWEIAIKQTLGKLAAPSDLLSVIRKLDAEIMPITAEHAEAVASLPLHHGDPFDRLLIAQAKLEGLTIMTVDSHFSAYEVPVA